MGIKIHRQLTGANAVHPFAFVQSIDPSLDPDNHVTAFKAWIDTANGNSLKIRNATNDGWITALGGNVQNGATFVQLDYVDIIETYPLPDLTWGLVNYI